MYMTDQQVIVQFFIVIIAVAAGAGWVLFVTARRKHAALREELREHVRDHSQTEIQLQSLQERIQHLVNEKRELELKLDQVRQQLSEAQQHIARYEQSELQTRKNLDDRIRDLVQAREALAEERSRVLEEEKRVQEEADANRTRIWALHEQQCIARLRELCERSDLYFASFDNTNLPDDFDPSLKPDFLIRFSGQYVLFDAKHSQSQPLQTYLSSQAKQTAGKLAGSATSEQVYPAVFFVVPSIDVGTLKTSSWFEKGFMFYAVSPEALEPVLAMFKRLEQYEFAEAFDPKDRERIVQFIASQEHHIRHQNAVHVLSALRGLQILSKRQLIPEQMKQEIDDCLKRIRTENFSPAALQKLMHNRDTAKEELLRLTEVQKPPVTEEELQQVHELLKDQSEYSKKPSSLPE